MTIRRSALRIFVADTMGWICAPFMLVVLLMMPPIVALTKLRAKVLG